MEILFRLAVGLFVIVMPTVLFLAMMRGLEALQDDQLVEQVMGEKEGEYATVTISPREFVPGMSKRSQQERLAAVAGGRDAEVTCSSCGARSPAGFKYCSECLEEL